MGGRSEMLVHIYFRRDVRRKRNKAIINPVLGDTTVFYPYSRWHQTVFAKTFLTNSCTRAHNSTTESGVQSAEDLDRTMHGPAGPDWSAIPPHVQDN